MKVFGFSDQVDVMESIQPTQRDVVFKML